MSPHPAAPPAQPRVSFEFFPPASEQGTRNLLECATELARFQPRFVSVTYGAGGTSQDRTLKALAELTQTLDVPVAGHLTTVNATKEAVHDTLDAYRSIGVHHVVALRGDKPQDLPPGGEIESPFASAIDLVTAIRSRPDGHAFQISVAAYPEVHPKATSPQADLDHLKAKVDAGADRAITQFFFDPEVFLRFVDRCQAAGITTPIIPGIMPVGNFAGISRMANRCGAVIPRWMIELLADLDDDPEVSQLVSASIAVEQCRRLAAEGIEDFHFYTLNRRHLTAATCLTLGLTRAPVTSEPAATEPAAATEEPAR